MNITRGILMTKLDQCDVSLSQHSIVASFWPQKEASYSDMFWNRLPNFVFEAMKNEGLINSSDINFLIFKSKNSILDAVAVIRIFASLLEEELCSRGEVWQHLVSFLYDDSAYVRNTAIEAFWQIADKTILPTLQELVETEKNRDVLLTLNYVIRIMS
jgi:hypothetical protein